MAAWDRYIATTGDDTNGDGSEGNPWKTLDKALDEAEILAASDVGTVHMAAGTYAEANDTMRGKWVFCIHWVMTNRVTVQYDGADPADVKIHADNSYAFYNTVLSCCGQGSCSNITFKNVTFDCETGSKLALTLSSGAFSAESVTITGMHFDGCRFVAGDGAANVSAIYAAHHAVVTAMSDIEFKDCTFTVEAGSNAGTVVRLTSATDLSGVTDFRILNCTIDCASVANVNGGILDIPVTAGYKVDRLNVVNGADEGLWFGSQRAAGHAGNTLVGTIDRVSVTTTGDHGLCFGALSTSTSLTARGCYSSTAGHALILKGSRNVVVENSLVIGTAWAGTAPLLFKGATGCTVQSNFVSSAAQRTIQNYDAAGWNTSNCVVKNNIFRIDTANAAYMFLWYSDNDAGGNTFDNNVYDVVQSGNANPMGVVMEAAAAAANLATLADLTTAWTSGSYPNNDAASVVEVAAVDANYIPLAGGNCDVGRGDPAVQPGAGGADYYGRPRLQAYARPIGAVYPQREADENIIEPVILDG